MPLSVRHEIPRDPKLQHPSVRYAKDYQAYSSSAPLRMFWDALWSKSKLARIGLLNRQKDYLRLAGDVRALAFHRRINEVLAAQASQWPSYDYGEGYFYQSLASAGITGLRDTEGRVRAMNLPELVAGRTVLEIGCNTGAIALALAKICERIDGFDINPFLIDIGKAAAGHLGIENAHFDVKRFEDVHPETLYDVVLSFANHSTYDRNTRQTVEEYFERCRSLLRPGGTLLFESHPPAHEGEGLANVRRLLEEMFDVVEQRELTHGTFLDRGRLFVHARKRT